MNTDIIKHWLSWRNFVLSSIAVIWFSFLGSLVWHSYVNFTAKLEKTDINQERIEALKEVVVNEIARIKAEVEGMRTNIPVAQVTAKADWYSDQIQQRLKK